MARHAYFFGDGRSDGNIDMQGMLGARGAHVCEMANLGLQVVPGFCLAAKACKLSSYRESASCAAAWPEEVRTAGKEALAEVEASVGRRLGDAGEPLLLSVRRGDAEGNAIANLGLNDAITEAWSSREGPHFVWDAYRRLILSFAG